MMTVEEVAQFMAILVPLILAFVVICFLVFVRWGKRENQRNRKSPPASSD
jgi:hypothetical protein